MSIMHSSLTQIIFLFYKYIFWKNISRLKFVKFLEYFKNKAEAESAKKV